MRQNISHVIAHSIPIFSSFFWKKFKCFGYLQVAPSIVFVDQHMIIALVGYFIATMQHVP